MKKALVVNSNDTLEYLAECKTLGLVNKVFSTFTDSRDTSVR